MQIPCVVDAFHSMYFFQLKRLKRPLKITIISQIFKQRMTLRSSSSLKRLLKPQKTRTFTVPTYSLSLRYHSHNLQPHIATFTSETVRDYDPVISQQVHHSFDEIPQRDISAFYSLLFKHSRENQTQEVLSLFSDLHRSGVPIDGLTLSCVLKACGSLVVEFLGRQVHCQCVKTGLFQDVSVGTSLVDMYMKSGSVGDGKTVFDQMGLKNVVSWTSLLSGYARNGLNEEAVRLFLRMLEEGVKPNAYTYATALSALGNDGLAKKVTQLHSTVTKNGFELSTSVGNSLINMYSKAGFVKDARTVFDLMENKDSVTWNSMIAGYVINGCDIDAVALFCLMRLAGVSLTQMTFATIVKACANVRELCFTRQLHSLVSKTGFDLYDNISTGFTVAYSKCSEMDDAFKSFSSINGNHNVVSWTAMICGCLQNGRAALAVDLFHQMTRESVRPNSFTYSTILTAQPFISPAEVHAQIIKTNYDTLSTVGTALLDSYIEIGNVDAAAKVFESIDEKDIIAWSAMLAGYAQTGDSDGALKTFLRLGRGGIRSNEFTYSSVINACAASSAGVKQGKQIHASSIKSGYSLSLCVSSALVTMYAKRGNIESANRVFQRQRERDLISWNSMISGYAQHGNGKKALEVFEEMRRQQIAMDGITFIGVLSACTHAGLVDEGKRYFDMMANDLRINPTMEHYSCLVDLYSRAGMLKNAMDVINEMPFPASATVWRSILAGCRVQRDLELGKLAAEKLIFLQPNHSAAYVLLSNIYAAAGNWKERAKVRKMMEERKIRKEAGYSWIEVKNKTYSFLAGDCSHPLSDKIYEKLEELRSRLKDVGYRPDTEYVLHDVEEEHKEAILSQHSERLALAFGLITTSPETPIQIVKNLRVCGDCHTFIKLTSMTEGREIVVRDSNRFHHFLMGACSCGDYW